MENGKERKSGGQGRVKDPAHDGRLKQNRAKGVSLAATRADRQPGGQGRVKNQDADRRLKQNREDGPGKRPSHPNGHDHHSGRA